MVNVKEFKAILKENKIHFYSYWDKKRLITLANEHDLLSEKSMYSKYDRLKIIKNNPRKVSLENVKTGKIKTYPSIYKAAKFIDQSHETISYLDGKAWKEKYKIKVQ